MLDYRNHPGYRILNTNEHLPHVFEFVKEKHGDQMYGNLPYIFHLLDVLVEAHELACAYSRGLRPIVFAQIHYAALAHDLLEDTPTTYEEVADVIGNGAADIVALLTKNPELSYRGNIEAIAASNNIGALITKLADNRANFKRCEPGDMRAYKYTKSMCFLHFTLLNWTLGGGI